MSQRRLTRLIDDTSQHWRQCACALALAVVICLWVGTSEAKKKSPIRTGLPGAAPTRIAEPDQIPVTKLKQSPIRTSIPVAKYDVDFNASRNWRPASVIDSMPRTVWDISEFDRSIAWSLHSATRRPNGVTVKPVDTSDERRLKVTEFDADSFDDAIESALSTLPGPDPPAVAVETPFDTQQFAASLLDSLSQVPDPIEPPIIPTTQYDKEQFEQSLADELALADELNRPVDNEAVSMLATTRFNRDDFDQAIAGALSELSNETADRPVRVTPFDRERFDRSIVSSVPVPRSKRLPPVAVSTFGEPLSRHPQTGFSVDRFQKAIEAALASARQDERIPLATAFDTGRFDRSVKASLASARYSRDSEGVGYPQQLPAPIGQPLENATPTCHPINDFSPTPIDSCSMNHDPSREQWVYDAKRDVPTQRPWVEWGRVFYGDGITPRGINLWGKKNLARPKFYVYGDYRTGVITGRNAAGRTDNWSNRLNLDFDLPLTDTERFHAFVGPLDRAGRFTRVERVGDEYRFEQEFDLTPVTGFFEGDLGVLLGTARGRTSPFELPVTIGLVPLLFQNGIWMEDAVTGVACALPARHSRLLKWANFDATFFAVFDQLNSVAFGGDEHAAQAFGTAWFIDAYGGYIESGYAYLNDRNFSQRSYHNITASFTRRYFDRISNSIRVIVNAGQSGPDRTADGLLLLVENSWISQWPLRVVPYANFFAGWDRPQSVARAGVSGGILRNTGINFDTDGLNGFSTLDPTANDTAGGSIGIDLIGDDLDRQLLLEFAALAPIGNKNPNVASDQYALGSRYQFNLTHSTLLRFDVMYGWRRGLRDVHGTRMEFRWKF